MRLGFTERGARPRQERRGALQEGPREGRGTRRNADRQAGGLRGARRRPRAEPAAAAAAAPRPDRAAPVASAHATAAVGTNRRRSSGPRDLRRRGAPARDGSRRRLARLRVASPCFTSTPSPRRSAHRSLRERAKENTRGPTPWTEAALPAPKTGAPTLASAAPPAFDVFVDDDCVHNAPQPDAPTTLRD